MNRDRAAGVKAEMCKSWDCPELVVAAGRVSSPLTASLGPAVKSEGCPLKACERSDHYISLF